MWIRSLSEQIYLNQRIPLHRGCSSVVERSLRMWEAPGSIPGISIYFDCSQFSLVSKLSDHGIRLLVFRCLHVSISNCICIYIHTNYWVEFCLSDNAITHLQVYGIQIHERHRWYIYTHMWLLETSSHIESTYYSFIKAGKFTQKLIFAISLNGHIFPKKNKQTKLSILWWRMYMSG